MAASLSSTKMAARIPATPEGVLDFWFGKVENTVKYFEANWPKWFGGRDVIFDVAQRTSASLIHQLAALDNTKSPRDAAWDSARGKLARIIALDQFSRCAFRGTAEAFAAPSSSIVTSTRMVAPPFVT